MKMKKSPFKLIHRLIIIIGSVIGFLFQSLYITPLVLSVTIYDVIFKDHINVLDADRYKQDLKEESISSTKYEIISNRNQKLIGYNYYKEEVNPKGLVIISHGFGGGHLSYSDMISYFVNKNYYCFGYDGTGTGESELNTTYGIPQFVIDLDYVLNFIKSKAELNNLPIYLVGHSCGGYAVTAILNLHTDIKGVVSLAGFNESIDLVVSSGTEIVGPLGSYSKPFLKSHEKRLFGDYSKLKAMDGFEKTTTKVFIVHSQDDRTVEIKYGYDIYYEKYKDNNRFYFKKFQNAGHMVHQIKNEDNKYVLNISLLDEVSTFFNLD